MPWCPNCKTEYQDGYTVCSDCGSTLVESLEQAAAEEAAEWLRSHTAPGDIVLFKGSRLARMEQVMNLTFPPQ